MPFYSDMDANVDASFSFDAPSKKTHAELRQEIDTMLEREEEWSPAEVARYCMLQDEIQRRRRRFRKTIKVIDGDKK